MGYLHDHGIGQATIGMVSMKEQIQADWKISKVLKEYPELLDTLANSHQAFGKLRNPLLRRVQSKLVTVEQAAGIAGLEPESLLAKLNKAAGFEVEPVPIKPVVRKKADAPAWVERTKVAEKLDVRPLIARGEEPFSMISGAAKRIPVGEALSLRSPFDPVPLREVLGKQGFEAYTSGAGEDWITIFRRVRELGEKSAPAPAPVAMNGAPATAEISIDVSELVPPEPMMKILGALEELPDGGQLTVHHVRRPMHLYPRLDEMGYAHITKELAPDKVELVITKPVPA